MSVLLMGTMPNPPLATLQVQIMTTAILDRPAADKPVRASLSGSACRVRVANSSPQCLLDAARQGEPQQLGSLLQSYRNYLTLLARTQMGRQLQARVSPSDVVQETMLEALQGFNGFRGSTEREFVVWLRQILINNLMRFVETHVRTAKRDVRREISMEQWMPTMDGTADGLNQLAAMSLSSPSAAANRREIGVVVADCLAKLPAHYREVIVLRNLRGLSFEEVARDTGRSAGSVRMLWMRAIDQFRVLLERGGVAEPQPAASHRLSVGVDGT